MKVAFIGFSEAGPAFAAEMIRHGASVSAFDLRSRDPVLCTAQRTLTEQSGARHCETLQDAIAGARIVMSTVTAAAALDVAKAAAGALEASQWFCDLNSVAPATKLAIRDALAPTGVRFVEAVAMGRISEGALPPTLLSGPHAPELGPMLQALGLKTHVASAEWGAAPAAKLLRSTVIKGVEAVLSEALEGAAALNAQDALLASLSDWIPGLDWPAFAAYHADRVAKHGVRRAAELQECAAFLDSLGVNAPTTRGAAARQSLVARANSS